MQLTLLISLQHPPVPSWANWGFLLLLSPTRLLWALATYPLSRTSLKSGPPTLNPLPPPAAGKRYMKGGGCKGDSDSFICGVGKRGHLWATSSPGSLPFSPADPQGTFFALTPSLLSWGARRPLRPLQLGLAGSGEVRNYLSSPGSGECALPKGSPSSAMALMRLLARTCTCFPLVRL